MPSVQMPQGHAIWLESTGPESAPAIVLSNSIGTTADLWSPIVTALEQSGYRIITYDARGHGRSSTPQGPYSLEDLADDVVGILDSLNIGSAHVAGISLGGLTSLMCAIRRPSRVRSVVAANTGAKIGTVESWSERARIVRQEGLESIVDVVTAGWLTPAFARAHPARVSRMRDWFLRNDPEGYASCCMALAHADVREALSGLDSPTLVIAAVDDVPTPPSLTRRIADSVPGATYREIPGAHLSVQESPHAFADAVLSHAEASELTVR